MGRALVRDASTFLFDEPLSNLDAKLRGQMRAELAETRQRVRKNMIYVTHDQVEAMTLGDRIVVMRAGRIMQVGSPEELFRRPANMFVAGFIGSPPMNFLPVTLEDGRAVGRGFAVPVAPGRGRGEAIAGLRPSAFRRDPQGEVTLAVEISEYVGAQSVLVGRLGGQRVQVELDTPAPIRVGESLRLGIDPEQLHLFDRATEAAL